MASLSLYFGKFIVFYLGCFCCWYLQRAHALSPYLAAAAVGFVGSFWPTPGPRAAAYSGAFAAMCSVAYLSDVWHVLYISILGTALYFILKPRMTGFGGKLGVVAFLASLILVFAKSSW
jgi:hypothetical protein